MIRVEDIHIPELCPVLGIHLSVKRGLKARGFALGHSPTLDRIDNKKGYIPGNVAVISWRANALKKDASLQELEQLVKWLREVQSKDTYGNSA